MMRYLWLVLIALCTPPGHAEVQGSRLHLLTRGINLDTAIYEQPQTMTEWEHDLDQLHQMGFYHVRIFFSLDWLKDDASSSHLARLDRIVQAAQHAHLAVILCIDSDRYPMTDMVNEKSIEYWIAGWTTVARHYQAISPDWLFYEIANEPGASASRWVPIQERLRATVRAIAPFHTLLLTPSPLALASALTSLPVSEDRNVVYVFHFYQPMVFSHQSAGWAEPEYEFITGLEYPPNPANIRAISRRPTVAPNPNAMRDLVQYQKTGGRLMADEITLASLWARAHNVPIVVTEFGVYATAPEASRASWLEAARRQFERAGFGWTVWQFEGSFGLKTNLHGCDAVVKSLGMC